MIPRIARATMLALVLATLPPAARAAVPMLAPEELHPGQKATVRTVFQGTAVETFEAEIVGVLQGGRAEGDLILARATTPRVIQSGVAQGMSGSPVYVDGKLIGALSSGWSFSKEPLFGITPIREMLPLLELPTHEGSVGFDPGTSSGMETPAGDTSFGEFTWSGDPAPRAASETSGSASGAPSRPTPLPVPLSCGGLHPAGLATLRAMFEPFGLAVVPGGRAPKTTAPVKLEPGSAVAVDLLRGDLHLAAIGTATYVDGDRVLIFGHPLFQSGDVRLPLSSATITTIVASELSSFKLGAPGEPLGILTQDRRTAMSGRLGPSPHLLPVEVVVSGLGSGEPRRFHYESIEDRTLAPQLLSAAAFNSVMESGGVGANQTLEWTMRLERRGVAPLTMRDVTTGESPVADLSTAIAGPLRFLFANPFRRLDLDRVSIDVHVRPGRDQWTLRGAELLGAAVRPGGTLAVHCEVERWRGAREDRTLRVAVPEDLPDGRYLLWLGGGSELNKYEASKLPARFRPTSLDEAWQRFSALRPSNQLYATLVAKAPEVTADGRDYPLLPNSALALLAGGQTAGDLWRRGDRVFLSEQRTAFDGTMRGELQIEVLVDSKAPIQ